MRFDLRTEGRADGQLDALGGDAAIERGAADAEPGAEQSNGTSGAPLGHELPSQSASTSLTATLASPTSPGLPPVAERRRSGTPSFRR